MSEIPNNEIIQNILENGVKECVIWLQSLSPNQKVSSLTKACSKTFKTYQSLNKNRSKSQGFEKIALFRNELFDWPIPKVVQNKSRADISLPKPDGAKRSTYSNML